jgi:hypothetical protein
LEIPDFGVQDDDRLASQMGLQDLDRPLALNSQIFK